MNSEDLTKNNEDFAILFPSISSIYVRFVSRPDHLIPDGRVPKGLPHGAESLNFFNEDLGSFYYKWGLYSAGHARLNPEISNIEESMIQKRDRSKSIVMGDSGGFQIATGVMKFPWEAKPNQTIEEWKQSKDDFRLSIMKWLEHTADLSMILDVPTAAIKKGHASSYEDCLRQTYENIQFFDQNRTLGKTRFLNILQGIREDQADLWWDHVKDAPFEGWAFGGENCANFYFILKRMMQMRDGGYFGLATSDKFLKNSKWKNEGWHPRNWLHFLGISRLTGALCFTILQDCLRKYVDPETSVSFDSSTAFVSVAHGQVFTGFNTVHNRFGFILDKGLDDKKLKGSESPFPWDQTPIGKQLKIGDICVRGIDDRLKSGKETKTSWDSFSYVLLMGHNAYWHIKATQQANRLFRLPRSQNKQWIPSEMFELQDLMHQVFTDERPMQLIEKNRKFLEIITGKVMGQGISEHKLFEFDVSNKDTFEERGDILLESLEESVNEAVK